MKTVIAEIEVEFTYTQPDDPNKDPIVSVTGLPKPDRSLHFVHDQYYENGKALGSELFWILRFQEVWMAADDDNHIFLWSKDPR